MNSKKLKILQLLVDVENNEIHRHSLEGFLGIENWQVNVYLRDLEKTGYLFRGRDYIRLQVNPKTKLIKELCMKFDIVKLLHGKNDEVLQEIAESNALNVDQICEKTGLSRATVYRAFNDFKDLGLIQTIVQLKEGNEIIPKIATILRLEKQ